MTPTIPMMVQANTKRLDIIQEVSLLKGYEQVVDVIRAKITTAKAPVVLSFINAHALNLCYKDQEFYDCLLNSDILLRDGKGMRMLYKALRTDPGVNFNGTDFIPYLLEQMEGKTIALLGTVEPYLQNAADSLRQKGIRVILVENGFQPAEKYIDCVREAQPDIVLLGMGMPKQEGISRLLKEKAGHPCLVINGGAIIDFIGGKVSRAPHWMRANGLEWLFRLLLEPRRLFRRYVIGNVLFLTRVLGLLIQR